MRRPPCGLDRPEGVARAQEKSEEEGGKSAFRDTERSTDRLDELTALVAILEAGSLAAAGRKLRRSPPAMTRLLASLEERLGARLIERTSRRLTATEAGRRLGEQARQVLAGYGDAMRETAAGEVRGELRVTAPLVFGRRHVTPIVASFLEAYPDTRVELVLNDRSLNFIEEGLDLAVRIGRLADSSLVARRVGEVRRLLVASPAYLARRGAPRKPADLAAHDVIFTSGPPGPLEWRFHRSGREVAVPHAAADRERGRRDADRGEGGPRDRTPAVVPGRR